MSDFNKFMTKAENYVFGRGIIALAPVDANGVPMGFRDVGNTPAFTTNVANTQFKHNSSRGGLSVQDFSAIVATDFSATIDIEDISDANLAAFLAGSVGSRTQVATPVTNETLPYLAGARYYQLGYSNSNPSGVQGVTSVSLKINEFENAATRVNSTPYTVGQIFKSGSNVYLVTTAGTSAGSAPTYDTAAIGNTTADGTAVVKFLGVTGAFTVDVDYQVSADMGRIGIITGGKIEKACTVYTATVPATYLTGLAGYTPVAGSRVEISTTGSGQTNGALMFISDNAQGPNSKLYIPYCTIAPSGGLSWITAQNLAKFTLDIGVSQLLSTVPQIQISRATPSP